MEAFLVSTGVVAIGEIGDKTQLLALILAARFRRPLPIILGILFATLLNHAIAGLLGEWVRSVLPPETLRWILGASFIAIAIWALFPDTFEEQPGKSSAASVFAVTFVAFFIAEIGDKTQIATVALAAKYSSLVQVVLGTTLGMLIANVPAVILGEKAAVKLPMRLIRTIAAVVFAALGVAVLLGFSVG
ncbi:MAG TPA: TMEM165/GDT1 family protein [Usitatibacteraceae bacterium]|nr:TMEM165/GDT1 family protein [Usitatibacteraceae bacterium]